MPTRRAGVADMARDEVIRSQPKVATVRPTRPHRKRDLLQPGSLVLIVAAQESPWRAQLEALTARSDPGFRLEVLLRVVATQSPRLPLASLTAGRCGWRT